MIKVIKDFAGTTLSNISSFSSLASLNLTLNNDFPLKVTSSSFSEGLYNLRRTPSSFMCLRVLMPICLFEIFKSIVLLIFFSKKVSTFWFSGLKILKLAILFFKKVLFLTLVIDVLTIKNLISRNNVFFVFYNWYSKFKFHFFLQRSIRSFMFECWCSDVFGTKQERVFSF